MDERRGTKRVRLIRSILLNGEHCEKDSVHEVSRNLAAHLIGEGSAEQHLEEGEEPEPAASVVNRMEHPGNADPKPKQIRPAPAKVKSAR